MALSKYLWQSCHKELLRDLRLESDMVIFALLKENYRCEVNALKGSQDSGDDQVGFYQNSVGSYSWRLKR